MTYFWGMFITEHHTAFSARTCSCSVVLPFLGGERVPTCGQVDEPVVIGNLLGLTNTKALFTSASWKTATCSSSFSSSSSSLPPPKQPMRSGKHVWSWRLLNFHKAEEVTRKRGRHQRDKPGGVGRWGEQQRPQPRSWQCSVTPYVGCSCLSLYYVICFYRLQHSRGPTLCNYSVLWAGMATIRR